jgi:hypothetical protein
MTIYTQTKMQSSTVGNSKRYEPKKINLNKLKRLVEKLENNGK